MQSRFSSLAPSLITSLGFVLVGCDRPLNTPPTPPETTKLATLAIPGVEHRGASIASYGQHVVVTWTAGTDAETNVYAAVSRDSGTTFRAPVRVNDVPGDARFTGEQAPRVALGLDIVVAWQSRLGGKSAIRLARSEDGGGTFSPASTVHKKGLEGARGWASLALDRLGAAHVVWLDTRPEPAAGRPAAPRSSGHVHGGAMATRQNIFHATIAPNGTPVESRVATDVCFCCKTSIAAAPDGTLYAVWRHIYPPNFRDMAVARSTDGGKTFDAPVRLSEDGWAIDGCPEDGPSMAVDTGGVVHIAWPTIAPGKTDRKAIFYTYSTDGGRTFAPRMRVDEPADSRKPAHPQLTLTTAKVVVTWDEDDGDVRRIRMREIEPDTAVARWTPRMGAAVAIDINATASYPAVANTPAGTIVAWTATGAPNSAVHLARTKWTAHTQPKSR